MENVNQINKIMVLIKYDYRLLYYFKDQFTSFKSQYVYQYDNENKYKVFLVTKEKYNKRIQKKRYYENLYLRNKYLYYAIFIEKLFSKYIRKYLYKDLLSLLKSAIITFAIEYFGLKTKFQKFLPSF